MAKAHATPPLTRARVASARAAKVSALPTNPVQAWLAALCVALLAAAVVIAVPHSARADNIPGQDEINAARAAVSQAASSVADLDAAVVKLESALEKARNAEAVAAELYAQALDAADQANATLADATARADEADAALAEARGALASVAQASYREGANLGTLGAVMTADGFDSAVSSSEVLARASTETAVAVQRVEAAELVARTMRAAAEQAAVKAIEAQAAAEAAYADAEDAATAAESAVELADATRAAAVDRLADLRGTTAALERERQEGLAAQRDKERRAAADKAIRDAEKASTGSGSGGSGNSGSGSNGSGNSGSGNSGSGNSGSGNGATSPGGNGGSGSGSGNGGSGSGSGNGGAGSGSGGSGSGSGSGDSGETPAPPEQLPPPPQLGGSKSSTADAQKAVAKGKTLIGYPYKLGGNSLAGFDCSWLTMTSWKAAGYTIPRSSQLQYNAVPKVALSQLRPGDLVFYGTDRNPTKIYHVALYIGDGLVVEAASTGTNSLIRAYDASWRIANLIPYAGRP